MVGAAVGGGLLPRTRKAQVLAAARGAEGARLDGLGAASPTARQDPGPAPARGGRGALDAAGIDYRAIDGERVHVLRHAHLARSRGRTKHLARAEVDLGPGARPRLSQLHPAGAPAQDILDVLARTGAAEPGGPDAQRGRRRVSSIRRLARAADQPLRSDRRPLRGLVRCAARTARCRRAQHLLDDDARRGPAARARRRADGRQAAEASTRSRDWWRAALARREARTVPGGTTRRSGCPCRRACLRWGEHGCHPDASHGRLPAQGRGRGFLGHLDLPGWWSARSAAAACRS
jgi:hypothetical protein